MRRVLTLTTDFGIQDPFVGIMKGVILNIAPDTEIVDITHQVEPQNIVQAARVIQTIHPYFPPETVHVVVVDPGVGGQRRALALKSGTGFFVGPDNGIFTSLLTPQSVCHELVEEKYFLKPVSSTFHGRDVFAPVAAWLTRGTPLEAFGPRLRDAVKISLPEPTWEGAALRGEVVWLDRFGNLATNISAKMLRKHFKPGDSLEVRLGRRRISGLVSSYSEVKPGELGAILNSWNVLEIFCREANAAQLLKVSPGKPVTVSTPAATKRKQG